jgi:hypothetical protein
MAELKARGTRQLLKECFDYPIFLFDAKHVGITATGEQHANELYPDGKMSLQVGMRPEDTAREDWVRVPGRTRPGETHPRHAAQGLRSLVEGPRTLERRVPIPYDHKRQRSLLGHVPRCTSG